MKRLKTYLSNRNSGQPLICNRRLHPSITQMTKIITILKRDEQLNNLLRCASSIGRPERLDENIESFEWAYSQESAEAQ